MSGVIYITPRGNIGNRLLQYLSALGIQRHAPEARIANLMLAEIGLDALEPAMTVENAVGTGIDGFQLDVAGLGDCLNRKVVSAVHVEGYPFSLLNYPPREVARGLIPGLAGGDGARGFGRRELVCSVRGAEILHAIHPDYLPLPPAYYRQLEERSGLELVFFGQIGNDVYSQMLQAAFPRARFVAGQGAAHDFEVLRRSVNLAPSISTFAWLAAWLSEAERVFLPVGGIFSPVQVPLMGFLPVEDPVFEYTLLPFAKGVDLYDNAARFFYMQEAIGASLQAVTRAEMGVIARRAAALAGRRPLLTGFDPEYYLSENEDVRLWVAQNNSSALHHYLHAGFREKRKPLRIDEGFYANFYPDAAMAIAAGHYADPVEHYLTVGRGLGYRPLP